ncbi:DUF4129 domain-containing transglutaminase family protein [Sporosarcina koreensis]|uniref:DUF4129 domain-containing transglutaminase family protein n=1 Tax=Sporosarcina koreensis TaxID=334735 RepID=UPI0005900C9E|nr:transglutaminase domain-containing protein [Sporosarcina koreensis]
MQIQKPVLVFLYILAFFLTIEWLRPIAELTETGHISHFYGFVALCMLFALLRIPVWIGAPVKIVYIFLSVQSVFYGGDFLTTENFGKTAEDLAGSLKLIWSGEWMELSYLFRTVLFFILLWMITYLLRFWMEYRKSIFLFFGMTVLFLAVVDTFTDFDASYAVLRVMVIGLFLLGILFPLRFAGKTKTEFSVRQLLAIMLPLGLALAAAALFALLVPVKEPAWPDPVPFIRSAAGLGGEGEGAAGGVSKVGYDPDDTQLGGPFRQDDTLVLEAYTDSRQYWVMETKDTYTTKGWVQSSGSGYPEFTGEYSSLIGSQVLEPPNQRADIELYEPLPILPHPYGFNKIQTAEMMPYRQEVNTQQLSLMTAEVPSPLTYRTEFEEPVFSLKALRDTRMEDLQADMLELRPYLQLPAELPARVSDLAAELTKDAPSVYQKAQAIERYFGRSGFVYSRDNVAVPKEDDDYVDQFLFETKRGYCDNFSTSMVVMLRSAGIPARWVKGYAPGELKRDEDRKRYYSVTNNQAHSWVEAYMPGYGWMPFEPTIGFNGVSTITYDIEAAEDDRQQEEELKRPELDKKKEEAQTAKRKKSAAGGLLDLVPDWMKSGVTLASAGAGIAAAVSLGLWFTRKKWLPRLHVRRARKQSGGWRQFEKEYSLLLRQLERIGITRPPGVTLAAYAGEVDRLRGDTAMSELTRTYEQGLYGNEKQDLNWPQLREMWEDLIINTCG